MILLVKNSTNNEERQYVLNSWDDLKELVQDYKGLGHRLERVRSFEEAKQTILQFFDASSYIKASFSKEKPVSEAGKPLAKSNPLLYAERFHEWLSVRQQQARQETRPTNRDQASKPEEPKPTFMDRVRKLFRV